MRMVAKAFALGTALLLCQLGSSPATAQTRTGKVVRAPRERLYVPVPVVRPYWDSTSSRDIAIAPRTTGSIRTGRRSYR